MDYIKNDGGRFKEYNIPAFKKNYTGDCAVRSIAIGLGQTYKQTLEDLCKLGIKRGNVPNDQDVYEEYLFSKGWVKNKPPRDKNGKKIQLHYWTNNRAIVLTYGHLTAVVDNTVNDTWDCREWYCNSYYTPTTTKEK
jgi:hypothetical protein